MKSRSWVQLTVKLPDSHHDVLSAQLGPIGFNGFQENGETLECFVDKKRWSPAIQSKFRQIVENLEKELHQEKISVKAREIKETNWNKIWEDSAGIINATDKIVIKPSWRRLNKRHKGKIVVHIDPKMSFGTGHHESTRLSLSLLQEYAQRGTNVLDFGCGTGVLAIAAAKLGAKTVTAIDSDEWATTNARENVARNRVRKIVKVTQGELKAIPHRKIDLILANLDLPTILQCLKTFIQRLKPGGIIILSGLLISDLSTLVPQLFRRNLVPLELIDENEWVALALVRS